MVANCELCIDLCIDESSFKDPAVYNNFLDFLFCFDLSGILQTDLYTKETDSRSYLNFSSSHPNHTFSGNVYAQSLRLRRIINNQDRLRTRLNELAEAFKVAGYPEKMVMEITNKVLNLQRDISVKERDSVDDGKIRVVSTFGADEKIVSIVKRSEDTFKLTRSFRNVAGNLFDYVKKIGPSIRTQVNNLKHQALGTKKGGAIKCNSRGCKCCKMLNRAPLITINSKRIRLASGSCKTYNIIYLAMCNICDKPYTGRTIDALHFRVNGHRHYYVIVLKKSETNSLESLDNSTDLYSLGLHLHLEHGCTDPSDFDRYISFAILEVVNPSNIEVKEFTWMHRLNSFQPVGINLEYPFGLPYLGVG